MSTTSPQRSVGRQLLIAVYAVFAVAAGARSAVQIATEFSQAPVAYLLSAFAAVVYLIATAALRWEGRRAFRIALTAILIEAVGVVGVGLLTVLDDGLFPDATVWSEFGAGYGYVPLLLPFIGLWWLWRRERPAPESATG